MEHIRHAILAHDKSRYALSKETGISQAHLSLVVSGQRTLSVETIDKLTEAMGLEVVIRPKRQQKGK